MPGKGLNRRETRLTAGVGNPAACGGFSVTSLAGFSLSIRQYLGLDALTISYHVECFEKILQGKCFCQHSLSIDHTGADEIESCLKREENRHRTNYRNLIIINAERRKRDASFVRCNSKYQQLSAALDRHERVFNDRCNTSCIDDTIESKRLIFQRLLDIAICTRGSKLLCKRQALCVYVDHSDPRCTTSHRKLQEEQPHSSSTYNEEG